MSVSDSVETDYPIVKDLLIKALGLLVELVQNPNRCDEDYIKRYEAFRLEVDEYNGV